jgi:hypothetical protein
METLRMKKASFVNSYSIEKLPFLNKLWFDLIAKYQDQGRLRYLDAAQLIKHAIGLQKIKSPKKKILLYLYWMPERAESYSEYRKHAEELNEFSNDMEHLNFSFIARTYNELWEEWDSNPKIQKHSKVLQKRYRV